MYSSYERNFTVAGYYDGRIVFVVVLANLFVLRMNLFVRNEKSVGILNHVGDSTNPLI